MSCLPASWNTNKRKLSDNSKCTRRAKRANGNSNGMTHVQTVHKAVKNSLALAQEQQQAQPQQLNVDPLLESISFVRLLSTIPAASESGDVVLVTRQYEEQFMRECKSTKERPCVMNMQCECMVLDPTQPFVGVQFVLPNTMQAINSDSRDGMCLLCLRKTTQILFYQTIDRGHRLNVVIQKHGNICDEPGEYHHNAMLICPPHGPVHCMPLPIVAHQRSNYEVVKKEGVLWVLQKNVGYEDFT